MVYVPPSMSRPWFPDLLLAVDHSFAARAGGTSDWEDPNPRREPAQDSYGRCLDPQKYAIIHERVDAWLDVLGARGVQPISVTPTVAWVDGIRPVTAIAHLTSVGSPKNGTASLELAQTLVDGERFGLDVGLSFDGGPTVFVDTVPDCGCDACDTGSADLLDGVDGWFLTVARGGALHARSSDWAITRTVDGSRGWGADADQASLDEDRPLAHGGERWSADPWF